MLTKYTLFKTNTSFAGKLSHHKLVVIANDL